MSEKSYRFNSYQTFGRHTETGTSMGKLKAQVEALRLLLKEETLAKLSEPARDTLISHQRELQTSLATIEVVLAGRSVYKPHAAELIAQLASRITQLDHDIRHHLAVDSLPATAWVLWELLASPIEVAFARSLREAAEENEDESGIRTPVTIYLEDGSASSAVESAVESLLCALGATRTEAEEPLEGSWFRRLTAWLQTSPEAQHLAIEVQRAIELRAIHEAQAKVDGALAEAVGKLLDSLKDEPNGIIQVGSILVVKSEGIPVVRQLSQGELAYLERHPHLMTNPDQLMKVLRDGVSTVAETSSASQRMLET